MLVTASTNEGKERLALFNSLYAHNVKNNPSDKCKETQLFLTRSLNHSLMSCLLLQDEWWVLAMLDVDDLASINEELGYAGANVKLGEIGRIIYKFCDNLPKKLKGFRCDDGGKADVFGVLLYCSPKLESCLKRIKNLMKRIEKQSNQTVSVGIAKMNPNDSFQDWKQRALKNIKIGKEKSNNDKASLYCDINVTFENNNHNNDENKNNQGDDGKNNKKQCKLGKRGDFEAKMKEIANMDEDDGAGHWIAAIMDADDLGSFLFANNNDRNIARQEIEKIEQEVVDLFEILGEDKNFGYKLADGDEFGLIIYDNDKDSEMILPGYQIIDSLISNIRNNCKVTVSIGYSKLDEMEMADDWEQRINKYLTVAKKNGKNRAYWGQKIEKQSQQTNHNTQQQQEQKQPTADVEDNQEDDLITTKTLQGIRSGSIFKLDEVKIIINNSDFSASLDHLKEVKECEVDPTRDLKTSMVHFNTSEISYQRLYKETLKFYQDNKNLRQVKLANIRINCGDKNCQECNNNNNNNNKGNGVFLLCHNTRNRIANSLFRIARQRNCVTNTLRATATQLFIDDITLIESSKDYNGESEWFVRVYCYLEWQKEIVNDLLSNLAYFENKSQKAKENNLSILFDFLSLVGEYLDQVSQLLVLFYICFDWNFISIFYPFIEQSIGQAQSAMLFCKVKTVETIAIANANLDSSDASGNNNSLALCPANICLEIAGTIESGIDIKKVELHNNNILQSMKVVSILKQLIYDIFDNAYEEKKVNENILNFVSKIESKLDEMIGNIKTSFVLAKELGVNIRGLDEDDNDNDNENKDESKKSNDLKEWKKEDAKSKGHWPKQREIIYTMSKGPPGYESDDIDNNGGGGGGDDLDDYGGDDRISLISGGDNRKSFELERDKAKESQFVSIILMGDEGATEIEMRQVPGNTLENVCVYLKYQNKNKKFDIDVPLRSRYMKYLVDNEFMVNYIEQFNVDQLRELILASNYMDIPKLLHFACVQMALFIIHENPDKRFVSTDVLKNNMQLRDKYFPEGHFSRILTDVVCNFCVLDTIKWEIERLIWIAYHKNHKSQTCLLGQMSKDIVSHILMFLRA